MIMAGILTIAIIILLACVIGWHAIFLTLGGVIAVGAMVWLFLVGSIVAFCIAIFLVFVLGSAGIFAIGILALIWTVLAIVLFPILFPLLMPLFILLLFISLWRRRQGRDKK